MRFSAVAILITALLQAQAPGRPDQQAVGTSGDRQLRTVTPLMQNWKFVQNDALTDEAALASTGADWTTVSLPHTWNAHDAANLNATSYRRGLGWYRFEFPTPARGARHWLEFGAASLVADVWLNGTKLGQHRGGFSAFRFDVTDRLANGRPNVLLVKADNREPEYETDPTAIDPIGGDYNKAGGLYRNVGIISTADPVCFDLGDLGGPGVYATTSSIADGSATVDVRAKVRSNAPQGATYTARVSLLDDRGQVVARGETTVALEPGGVTDVAQELRVQNPHLWQGVEDPYLYQLVAELVTPDGSPADRVVQSFGIREMRFDPNQGFFLNGKHVPLRGVAMHQDYLEKSWATTPQEMEESLKLIMEVGANAVRFGHYQFSPYMLQRASELGLVVWSEKPSGLRTTVETCTTTPPTEQFMANARQQLQEMIRQHYNQAAVAMWSIANETAAGQSGCDVQYDNVTPYLRDLHQLAKKDDPSRSTALAEFTEGLKESGGIFGRVSFSSAGITDIVGTNRYYLWYNLDLPELDALLDVMRERYPDQPLGITEYGAGAAISHHTDNVLGGPPEVRSASKGLVSYQPEEYAGYFHEQNYRVILGNPYLWGTFVWNMFDFGSDHRNEGDVQGVNTKGLVTFDRKTKKDPFYFYKANWSREPVTYITSRRYTDRAYPIADVRIYSNADSLQLSVNGRPAGSMKQEQCELKTCIFRNVPLSKGTNKVVAVGTHGGKEVTDSVEWSYNRSDVNIAAGRLATGLKSSTGARFGSDHMFEGGAGFYVDHPDDATGDIPQIAGTEDPALFKYFRQGTFTYNVPLPDGTYQVTLGFVEPNRTIQAGQRVFDVIANGQTKLEKFDVLQAAGGPRTAVTRSFQVPVSGGQLRLEFSPVQGEAIVSNIRINPAGQASPQPATARE